MGACTNYQYIDTGLANGKHDCSVWEYLHTQPDDWDSTIIMIEYAGMKEYFDGSRPNEQITFFGITNLSILAYMLDYNEAHPGREWKKVQDIPVETCRHILKRLIVPQRLVVDDVPRGNLEPIRGGYSEVDGKVCHALEGEVFVYTYREDFNYIPEKGEIGLYMYLRNSGSDGSKRIVSTDIQMNNGVVHALSYSFNLKGL
jgi:putative lipoprotein